MIGWSSALGTALMAAWICTAMIAGVLRLRFNVGSRWVGIACCITSVVLSSVMVVLMTFGAVISRETLSLLKDDRRMVHVSPDWGEKLPPEQRTAQSKFIARDNYVTTGVIGNHIDLKGTLRLYELTDEDLQARKEREESLRMLQRRVVFSSVEALGFLLIPWIGVMVGYFLRPGLFSRTLIAYPKNAGE